MPPTLTFLTDDLTRRIVEEAVGLLATLGVSQENDEMRGVLADHGGKVEGDRVWIPEPMVEAALETVPGTFHLYDAQGRRTHDLGMGRTYFTPGSAALTLLDHATGEARPPTTSDYVAYAKVVDQLRHIASQSTAFVPADVHEDMSDSWRLYLSLLHGEKPVVTGTFKAESFQVMRDLQVAVRGDEAALAKKPLTIFTACSTTPLAWSEMGTRNIMDCARSHIPLEIIAFPMAGFTSPVTLVGTLIQHTAEVLSGVVMAQLAQPGTPLLWGTSSTPFDVRYETAPLGAVETMMIGCGVAEIGHHLGMPTQAYIGLSDAKLLDAQAGLESGMGALLATLANIDNCSGPGMMDLESCQSLEKLVVDNEICGMCRRVQEGIEPREDFPSLPRFKELLADGHLIISDHSRKHLRDEHFFPGPVIDRAPRARWAEEGSRTLGERAHAEVEALLASWEPPALRDEVRAELRELMEGEAKRVGQERLPA